MKHLITLSALFLTCSLSAIAQKAGEKIQINSSGSWYDGKILKVEGAKYFVTYDGWSDSWDEWVGIERIRGFQREVAPAPGVTGKYKVGDKVEASYGFLFEPASIIEVGENKYKVAYENTLFGTKWLTEREIKKL